MSYLSNVNYYYSSWFDASNSIPNGTYGNVSLLTFGKAELGQLSTTSIGVGCNSSLGGTYILDVSGNQRIKNNLVVSGNIDVTGNVNSSWLDASLNLRALDTSCVKLSGDQTIDGSKSLTGILNSTQDIIITNNSTRQFKVRNSADTENSSITYSGVRTTGYYWGQSVGGNSYRGTKTGGTNFYLTNDELSYVEGVTSSIQTQLNNKASTSNTMLLTGNQTASGNKVFTGDVSFNIGVVQFQNGLTTSNSIVTSSSIVGMTAMRMSGGSIQTNGGFYFPNTTFRRKLTLAPSGLGNNDFQQFSIGTIGVNTSGAGTLAFNIASDSADYTFSYGTSSTTNANIMKLSASATMSYAPIVCNDGTNDMFKMDPVSKLFTLYQDTDFVLYTGASTQRVRFTPSTNTSTYDSMTQVYNNSPINVNNASGLTYITMSTTSMDMSGAYLRLENMKVAFQNGTTITSAVTIQKPWNEIYAVESTSTAYTITLPTIISADLGKSIMFRKVKQGGTGATISFIGNGTQKVYNNQLSGVTTANGLMPNATYIVRLMALPDTTTGGGALGWFQV